jgi:hypothetical protein
MTGLFSPSGFTLEQSTAYHNVNRSMWRGIATLLAARPDGGDLTALNTLLARADLMAAYLTAPTGAMVPIGDALVGAPVATSSHPHLGVTDRVGGVAAWRWSWTDPATSFWTQRFGPKVSAHGHFDHTAVTWNTLGLSVLTDPGWFSYDARNPLVVWQKTPAAHNLAVPVRASVTNHGATLVSLSRSGAVDTSVLRSKMFSIPVTRTTRVNNSAHSLTVTDAAAGAFVQHFHLALGWVPSWRTARTVSFVNGHHRLTISVDHPGATLTVKRGARSPVAGWTFPTFEQALPSVEVQVTGKSALSTRLVVTTT